MSNIPKMVDERMNKDLTSIPSSKEIEEVVMSFEGDKAPSLDGFYPLFLEIVAYNL